MKELGMTPAEFEILQWPEQCRVLRALDNAASNCTGKTLSEANKKRAPYLKQHAKLQKIHDDQQRAWIERGVLPSVNKEKQ